MLKTIKVLLYAHFYNNSLNALRPTFFNIYHLPFSHFPNIKEIRVKVGPRTNYFSYFMSSCTDIIVVFNIFFWLIFSQPREKQNRACNFLLFKYFLNNLRLTVFMQNSNYFPQLPDTLLQTLLSKKRVQNCSQKNIKLCGSWSSSKFSIVQTK